MNKEDQKYLLNSEILVIVQHMMAKRRLELEKKDAAQPAEETEAEAAADKSTAEVVAEESTAELTELITEASVETAEPKQEAPIKLATETEEKLSGNVIVELGIAGEGICEQEPLKQHIAEQKVAKEQNMRASADKLEKKHHHIPAEKEVNDIENNGRKEKVKFGKGDGDYISSDDDLSYYSGCDTPPLNESDLCDSDINTDDLISTTTDNETPEHHPIADTPSRSQRRAPPIRKQGSFFQFMIKRAQKWRKKKSKKWKSVDSEEDMLQAETEVNTSAGTRADANIHSELSDSPQSTEIINILDPRNLPTEMPHVEQRQYMSSDLVDSFDERQMEKPQTAETNPELAVKVEITLISSSNQEAGNKHQIDCDCGKEADMEGSKEVYHATSPPGLIVSKLGYYGLSEGDIPGKLARCESEVSVNTILSAEDMLVEYVHDMSRAIDEQNHRKHVDMPRSAITKLVCSLDNLHLASSTPESLSKAVFNSLLDLRADKGEERRYQMLGCSSSSSEGESQIGQEMNESRYADFLMVDDAHAPIASGEVTPFKNDIYSSVDGEEDTVLKSPAKRRLFHTLVKYVRQFPKAFQRQS